MSLGLSTDGITLAKRIEWKRLEVEDAIKRLAADRLRSRVYVEAAVSRWRELEHMRAALGGLPKKYEGASR